MSDSVRNGLLWLAGGVGVTALTYAMTGPGGLYIVAIGPIGYGILQIVSGWLDAANDDPSDEGLSFKERIARGKELAARAAYFIAEADGGYDGARGAAIERALWALNDREVDVSLRAELQASVQDASAFLEDVRQQKDIVPPELREAILVAGVQVARAEHGVASADTEPHLRALADALGLPATAVTQEMTRGWS